ncbi:ABC transporter B family member 6-like, partial [Macadamia integrifolia]|uniref:ABC transporter B family member 6-like n=1 Tax=Macadamia integrifolia TaxID=60698 RepID=UPI001C4FEA38
MMISRGLFGWSPPHIQPLTPVSEVSEPPESPSPYLDNNEAVPVEDEEGIEESEEIEPPPAAVPFSRLFACADGFDWVLMVVGSLAAAAHGTALVVYLHYFGKVIQILDWHKPSGGSEELFQRFTKHALYIIYIASGVFAAGWIEVSCWILTGERQTAVIRSKYVQVLLNQDMSFFDTYGNNGDIVSQVLSDVLLIQSALSEKVGNYIHNMATFFSGLVVGLVNCWQIALITLATGPFIVAAGGISNIFLHRLAENIQDAYAEAASIAEQAVSYVRTLYAFTNETLAKYSYATSLQATLRYGILISLVQGLGLGFTYGLAICSCALQLWVGRFLISHGRAHGGEIVIALFAVILSGLGLNQAATNFYSFEQGRIAAYRLYEMISRSTSSVNQDGNILASVQGNIEFRNVYFSYLSRPEIPILSGFYLTVPARKTLALVGRNGSGKSSIIPLMERFYDPTLGEVLLDGKNIKSLKLDWLRSQIGLVTQEPALLSLSIRDNIAYGRSNVTSDQIEEAAK